jgi:sigma-B regulation protein RsbU (phosphoserine phosphatase)
MPTGLKEEALREELLTRRERLQDVEGDAAQAVQIERLLREVDDALQRFDGGTYGLCDVCHDPVERERLYVDPLLRTCLDHLTPAEQQALQRDLDLASRVQGELLPKRNLALDGWDIAYHYEPVGVVSGDYCDVVPPDGRDGDVYFLLGDVAGKGVAASMLMAALRAIVRTLMDANLPLSALVERANRLFCESTLPSHFATLVVGRADAKGQVEICNGGHPPPLVVRREAIASVASTGLPLGLFCSSEYTVTKYVLAPGDVLLLYSDGLSEARDRSGAEYGAQRIAEVARRGHGLPPRALVDACLKDLLTFAGGTPRADDLTVMAIRRS